MNLKRYRVSLEKVIPDPEIRNPFLTFRTAESLFESKIKVLIRTWEFEAVNEEEIRRLFVEATVGGISAVQGMKIRSIEEIKETKTTAEI